MFLDRSEIKQEARSIIGDNTLWLQMFLAIFLVGLPVSILSGITTLPNMMLQVFRNSPEADSSVLATFAGMVIIGSIIQLAATILIIPFTVGLAGYFLSAIRDKKPEVTFPFKYGKQNYGSFLITSIVQGFMIFLWSLLLYIPGIIMAYAYLFVPYIICDNPSLTPSQALDISKRMTKGYKADLFIMHCSFILWGFGVAFTFGLLAVYVTPYMQTVQALYYERLKKHAIQNGIVSADEFGGLQEEQNIGFDYNRYDYQSARYTPVAVNPDFQPYQPNFSAAPVDQGYPVYDAIDQINKTETAYDTPEKEKDDMSGIEEQ